MDIIASSHHRSTPGSCPQQLQSEWLPCLSALPRLLSLWLAPALTLRIAVLPGLQESGARSGQHLLETFLSPSAPSAQKQTSVDTPV